MGRVEQEKAAKVITSAANPQYKDWLKLLQSRGIKDAEQAFIFGSKATREAHVSLSQTGGILGWITCAEHPAQLDLKADLATDPIPQFVLSEPLFSKLDLFGTKSPILWTRIPKFGEVDGFKVQANRISLVIPFQNPENVGALLRSAAAFGVHQVLLTEECAHPFHPKSVRAASGALLALEYFRGPKLEELQLPLARCVGLSAEGKPLDELKWPAGGILIPGIEGAGLPKNLRDKLLLGSIPMATGVESLNGMVATSLALYEWRNFLSKSLTGKP